MKYVRLFFYYMIQFTWGLPQNILGFLYFLKFRKADKEWYHGARIMYHNGNWGGVSLGMFIVMNGGRNENWIRDTKIHEYGHTVQSLILGPLYLFVIGIPSFVWCSIYQSKAYAEKKKSQNISYYKLYTESWANSLGQWATGKKLIEKR